MEKEEFKKLLFKVAFCTMACDGQIHEKEIEEMKLMDKNTSFFSEIDLSDELIQLIADLEKKGAKVIEELFSTLKSYNLNAIQELLVLEVALRIISADKKYDENEIRFLHFLRSKLKVHDEIIVDRFGEVDILYTNEYSKNIHVGKTEKEYFENIKLPELEDIKEIDLSNDEIKGKSHE